MTETIIAALALAGLTIGAASAEQRFYDSRGRSVGTSSTDSQGTTTFYDARGNVVGRSSRETAPTKKMQDDCYGRAAAMSGKPCH